MLLARDINDVIQLRLSGPRVLLIFNHVACVSQRLSCIIPSYMLWVGPFARFDERKKARHAGCIWISCLDRPRPAQGVIPESFRHLIFMLFFWWIYGLRKEENLEETILSQSSDSVSGENLFSEFGSFLGWRKHALCLILVTFFQYVFWIPHGT